MSNRSTRSRRWPLAAFAALAACGGAVDPGLAARADAVPAAAILAAPAAPAAALLRAGQTAAARSRYEAALAADPVRLAPLDDLAVSYYLDGHVETAIRLLDEVVAHGAPREQQVALADLGELHAVQGYATAAQAYLQAARDLDAGRAEPHYALALLDDARGDDAGARAELGDALRLDDGTARAALAFGFDEERVHLDALVAEQAGDRAAAAAAWRTLAAGRVPALAAAAARHLAAP